MTDDTNSPPIAHQPPLPLIDSHCHLDMSQFDGDRNEVIERAMKAGFEAVITVGSDLAGSLKAVELAERYDFIYAAVGIHPHDAREFTDDAYALLSDLLQREKVVAVGETGLDYHYDHSPRDVQRNVFRRHLTLAKENGKPVIIHSREAKTDTLDILGDAAVSGGVMHCFSGDANMAEEVMGLGLSISLAGPVTFRKSEELRKIAMLIPDDYLLIETDAPYLAPEPFRGRRNEPVYLEYTARRIAALRGITPSDVARITTLNAKRLFAIGSIPETAQIAYRIRDSLYLNITNRCTNKCSFCVKFRSDFVKGHMLRLGREPSEEEVKAAIGDPSEASEVVFCGYGEPLQRLDLVKNIASWVKERGVRVRINTNGHANMIHRRNILPELKGIIDSISISLDAQDEETYDRICRPVFANAYREVLRFIALAKETIPDVQVTVVEIDGVDVEKCRRIAEELGVKFRLRKFDVVG